MDTVINTDPIFTVLAHIARLFMSFMVDSLGWRLAISFMVRSVQSHSFVYRKSEALTNCGTGRARDRGSATSESW